MSRHHHPQKPKLGTGIRPHPWLLWTLLIALAGAALSGMIWTVLVEFMEKEGPELRSWAQIHGAFAFLGLILVGSLLPQHVRFAWAAHRNRISGTLTMALMALLALTGYGLYYGSEAMRSPVRWTHIIVGLIAVLALPVHLALGRLSRPKRHH